MNSILLKENLSGTATNKLHNQKMYLVVYYSGIRICHQQFSRSLYFKNKFSSWKKMKVFSIYAWNIRRLHKVDLCQVVATFYKIYPRFFNLQKQWCGLTTSLKLGKMSLMQYSKMLGIKLCHIINWTIKNWDKFSWLL